MTPAGICFRTRLAGGAALVLDGAVGTELNRRGIDTALPLWSAAALIAAPAAVEGIHRDYVAAGADIITANTFRTHARSLAAGGAAGRGCELTAKAVSLARAATAGSPDIYVAGSMAPLEDCYEPERVPEAAFLAAEHTDMAANLAEADVDLILVETMNTAAEALAAAAAAQATGLPTMVSLVCGRDGRLLSGEAVGEVARQLAELGVDGVMINCAPAPQLEVAMGELTRAVDLPFGAYGNVGYADAEQGWVNTDSTDPLIYARYAARWLDLGARVVGSCCGTGPDHTAALRRLVDGRADQAASRPSSAVP